MRTKPRTILYGNSSTTMQGHVSQMEMETKPYTNHVRQLYWNYSSKVYYNSVKPRELINSDAT